MPFAAGVLNSPTSSFWLVSILIAGCPAAIAAPDTLVDVRKLRVAVRRSDPATPERPGLRRGKPPPLTLVELRRHQPVALSDRSLGIVHSLPFQRDNATPCTLFPDASQADVTDHETEPEKGPAEISPDKNDSLLHTPAAFTRRLLMTMSLTTSSWLAQTASPLMRIVFLRPRTTHPASYPPRLTTTQLPLACVGIITFTGDSHPQAACRAYTTVGPQSGPHRTFVVLT